MLAAGAAGAIGVDLEVLFVDLDLDILGQFGKDENRGEGCVALGVGVEGRNAHQAMDAHLGAQKTVSVVALNGKGHPLGTGLLAGLVVGDLGTKPLLLAEPQVHAQQHLRPVLGFGPAGAGVDADDAVGLIMLSREHAGELHGRDLLLQLRQEALNLLAGRLVLALLAQLHKDLQVLELLRGVLPVLDQVL